MTFVRNNIRYRSAASKALEGYYNSKAFILNELISRKNGFSETAKEILLLLLNKHADWLAYSEQLLLDKNSVSNEDARLMCASLQKVAQEVDAIFAEHDEVFDADFIQHWIKIRQPSVVTLCDSVMQAEGMTQIIAFPYATECLIEYLNATLFELYELDCLLGSNLVKQQQSSNCTQPEKLILCVDDMASRYHSLTGSRAELERFNYYVDVVIDMSKDFSVELRDYSNQAENSLPDHCEALRSQLGSLHYVGNINVVRPHLQRTGF